MSNTQTATEFCKNCGRAIGRLETPRLFENHIVCVECLTRLTPPPPVTPPRYQPPPLPAARRPRTSRHSWLWFWGIVLILAGLESFAHFPQMLTAPFLIAAGFLLVPPGWTLVAAKWPVVAGSSGLIRGSACVLAIAVMLLLMPKQSASTASSYSGYSGSVGASSPAPSRPTREDEIKRGFSGWDGSNTALAAYVQKSMNDPSSYEHVETRYTDLGDSLLVRMTYRGKNLFGALVENWVKAKVSVDGRVLQVTDQGVGP